MLAVNTSFLVSTLCWFNGLVPDFATLRNGFSVEGSHFFSWASRRATFALRLAACSMAFSAAISFFRIAALSALSFSSSALLAAGAAGAGAGGPFFAATWASATF